MHYACILGCNDEWCEQRPSLGDIGLAKCLLKCGLPKDNLLELYDKYATRSSILTALEELLDHRNNNRKEDHHQTEEDSLLFYYGGHGIRYQFCTHTGGGEPQIRHSDIIELLERKFHSGIAWIILDCCHSGSFGEAVLAHKEKAKKLNVQYGCIMSVAPDDKAGMEWTMTECLIKAFQCELSLFPCDGNKRHYLLSTIKGKHPIKENSIQQIITDRQATASSHPSWEQVIDFLADEMARIKGDRLTNLFIGEGMEDGSILKRPCLFGRDESQSTPYEPQQNEKQIIPRNLTWTENDHFHRNKFAVNDGVDVKWCGPVKKGDRSNYLIGWFRGRIRSSDEKVVVISLFDALSELSWTTSLPIDSPYFLFGLPFGFGFNTQHRANAVSKMAAHLCYLDNSVPPLTKVDVLWSDGKVYEGETVMSWSDMDHSLEELEEKKDVTGGPLMSIYWVEEDSISLEPSSNCRVKDESSSPLKPADFAKLSIQSKIDITTPLQAMLTSIEKAGKKLLSELPTTLTNGCHQGHRLEAYDADEDCIWLPIQVINIDPTLLPLKVLASHMCYQEAGDYVTVFWEQDSTLSLIPISFLKTKSTEDGSNSDDSSESSEDESNDGEIARDAADVRRYIEESAREILKMTKREKSSRIRLVCVNDVYSFDDLDCNDESVRGGWSRATTLMQEMRSDPSFDTALTIVNGDVLGGSSLLQHCQGKVAIETMNAIPVDLAVLGNHEFDYGDEVLKQRIKESKFDWLGSNVYYTDEGNTEPSSGYFPGVLGNGIIHTVDNVKLGFFGLVTKSTPKISSPSANVVFDADVLSVARKTASSLRSRGADVIIAITHMSEEEDKLLASDKVAGVNLVLGGHEHESLAVMVHRDEEQEDVRDEQNDDGVLVFKCGMDCNWVGCVDLDIAHSDNENGSNVTSISTSWSMNAVTKRTKEDNVVSDIVKKYRKKTDQESLLASFGRDTAETLSLDDVIATITPSNGSSLSLDTRMSSVRRREATGGNLIADCMHWLIETNIGTSATGPLLAMINGGFIRGDRQYSPGSDFTVRHILKELPFPRTMEVLEIRGAAMREAMRQQLQGSSKGPTGAFPHLSSNSKLEYVTSDDDDVSIITFKVNGVEVDDDQLYIIGVTSFVADGNEGCKSWLDSTRVQNEAWNDVFISKVLLQYLSCHRNISPSVDGRVKRR